jgi:hypothetical protein
MLSLGGVRRGRWNRGLGAGLSLALAEDAHRDARAACGARQ